MNSFKFYMIKGFGLLEHFRKTLLIIVKNEGYFLTKLNNQIGMCSCCFEAACCCCLQCCKECKDACLTSLGKEKVTKISYLLLVIIFTLPAVAILFFINKWQSFRNYFSWMRCPSTSGGQLECIGASTVFRISLSFLVLFFIMLIFMLCRNKIAMAINEGLFLIKYLVVLGIFIGFLFVTNKVFDEYAQASKYISIIYMIIQSVVLIDLFYLAGIKLVRKYDEGNSSYIVLLVVLTVISEGIAIFLNIYGYILFGEGDNCGNTLWINIITSIILVLLPIIQCFNFNKQNSLLTTALVSAYVSYLSFICQFSFGNECYGRMTIKSIASDIIVSTFLFILTTYGTIMGGSGQFKKQDKPEDGPLGVAPTQLVEGNKNASDEQLANKKSGEEQVQTDQTNLAKYSQGWGWVKWHLFMCIASIYMGMLLTNWTSASLTTGDLISNGFGFWVRATISWLIALVYIWTLIAPKICPQRDFTVI